MNILLFTKKTRFLYKNEISNPNWDNETYGYTISIDFYDHQIDSIIGPTMKTFNVEDKIKMSKCVKLFILHTEYLKSKSRVITGLPRINPPV